MFNLAKTTKAPHGSSNNQPSNGALTWTTPVHFDATLVVRLVDQHRELNVRVAELVAEIGSNPQAGGDLQTMTCAVRDCANRLHDLRRFDELAEAIQQGTETRAAADQVARAFAEYRRRNEAEMYPLYDLMQLCELHGSQAA